MTCTDVAHANCDLGRVRGASAPPLLYRRPVRVLAETCVSRQDGDSSGKRGATNLEAVAEDFSARLTALSKVHSAVFQADGESIPIAEIVDLTFNPYRQKGASRIDARGPAVTLSRTADTTLALLPARADQERDQI